MKTTTEMRLRRKMAFADPKAARKAARNVKAQAELRKRLNDALLARYPSLEHIHDGIVDVVIEELKK